MTTTNDNEHDGSYLIPFFGPPEHFGGCPKCGRTGVYVDIGPDHYFICRQHRVYWCVGSNLFSAWRYGTQEEWEANRRMLESWTEVSPVRTRLEMRFPRLARNWARCNDALCRVQRRLAEFWAGKPADDIPF